MAAAPKPSGGRKPGQFGTTELRLGRATGIGEFFDVLEDATAKRMERMAKGYLHAITASALSPLPTFAQASIYDAITDPFGGGKDSAQESTRTAEREPNLDKLYNVPLPVITQGGEEHGTAQKVATAIGIGGTRVPLWQSNLEKLFKVPLLITEKKDTLKLIETERESEPEKVKDEEKSKFSMKEFFGGLFGGIIDIGAWILKGIGTLAIAALRFTGGLGIMGLMASLLFNKEIVDLFRKAWGKESKKMGANTQWGAMIARLFGGGTKNGASFAKAAEAGLKGGAIGAAGGLVFGGLPGALVGFILGSAFFGLGAALGEAKITLGTNFIATWLEKTWEAARMEWEDAKQVGLNAELDILKKRAKEVTERIKSGKAVEGELILIQMKIKAKEKELLASRREYAEQYRDLVDNEYKEKISGIRVQKESQKRLKLLQTALSNAQKKIEEATADNTIDEVGGTIFGSWGKDTKRKNIMDELSLHLIKNIGGTDSAGVDASGEVALQLLRDNGILSNDNYMNIVDPQMLSDPTYRDKVFGALDDILQKSIRKDQKWLKGTGEGAKMYREAIKKIRETKDQSPELSNAEHNLETTVSWTKTLDNAAGPLGPEPGAGAAGQMIPIVNNNNDGSVHNNSSYANYILQPTYFSTDNLNTRQSVPS